ncbi:MAG TPA: hypothetical protein VIJ46_05805, partial [Rhabdochlamydiaceae bacterium]
METAAQLDTIFQALYYFAPEKRGAAQAILLQNLGVVEPGNHFSLIERIVKEDPQLDDPTYQLRNEILSVINHIPQGQEEAVTGMILPLIQDLKSKGHRYAILRVLRDQIPADQREDIIKRAMPYAMGIVDGVYRSTILRTLSASPQGQFFPGKSGEEVVGAMKSLIQDVPEAHHGGIFDALREINPTHWEEVVQAMVLIRQGREPTLSNPENTASILWMLKYIFPGQRADVVAKALAVTQDIKQIETVFKILNFFAPENREAVKTILMENGGEPIVSQNLAVVQPGNHLFIINWILQGHPQLVDPTHDYLIAALQSLQLVPEQLRWLASEIWDDRSTFHLYQDELPLAQAVMNALILTEKSNDPKNPYNLYAKLKKISAEEVPVFKTQGQEIEKTQVALDPAVFQASAKEQKKVTFADLPPGIGPNTLSGHFDALQARLSAMDAPEKAAAEKYIQDANEVSLSLLHSNFTADATIGSLVRVQGAAGDAVPLSAARFFAIIKFISDQSDQIAPGEILSPREDVLLKISASIQNCA